MIPAPDAVRDSLTDMKATLKAVPDVYLKVLAIEKDEAEKLNTCLRKKLLELEAHNVLSIAEDTRDLNSFLTHIPSTSASIVENREKADEALRDELSAIDVSSFKTIDAIYKLPAKWALEKLITKRTEETNRGCWIATTTDRYNKINLRSTRSPLTGQLIGVQVYAHQLAIIAGGQGDQLPLTRPGDGYEVSHLCHQAKCFNPEHVTVEPQNLNKRRQRCHGAKLVKCNKCHATFNPCPHGKEHLRRHCVLEEVELEGGRYLEEDLEMGHQF